MAQRSDIKIVIDDINLKGYKSINDLTLSLDEGLNILIGKNSSGKSNFLEGLNSVLSFRATSKSNFKQATIFFSTSLKNKIKWEIEKEIQDKELDKEYIKGSYSERLTLDGKLIFNNQSEEPLPKFLEFNNNRFPIRSVDSARWILTRMGLSHSSPLYVKFNLPEQLECISSPGTLSVPDPEGDFEFWPEFDSLNFVVNLFWEVELHFTQGGKSKNELTKSSFLRSLKINDRIKTNLARYTPIQDIRFNENINLYKSEKLTTIDNLKIDFKLNNKWIPWSYLSDGTKRLFYLVSEITNEKSGIVLVEEPELGVHPHQFDLVMEFLKEESRFKQIIISTHSPQALNHLEKSELKNILVSRYTSKTGTQIKHLSAQQQRKANLYMQSVGFLSDYWLTSNLEE